MGNYILHAQESVNRTISLYARTMEQRRMLYIHKFYAVKITTYPLYVHMLNIRKFYLVRNYYLVYMLLGCVALRQRVAGVLQPVANTPKKASGAAKIALLDSLHQRALP